MLILKILVSASNQEIFKRVTMQDYMNTFLTDWMEPLLRRFKIHSL